jgi:hypothetical protein
MTPKSELSQGHVVIENFAHICQPHVASRRELKTSSAHNRKGPNLFYLCCSFSTS